MIYLCGFGVSNYYNKLKLILLEKNIPFEEKLIYPWQRESFLHSSPLGKIPYIQTDRGDLSESQVILEYLEETYSGCPMYSSDTFEKAKCRELIQHVELNSEWVARRLYKEAFFGGTVSDETKTEARQRLNLGLHAIHHLARFSPYILGATFGAADCIAYVHFIMIKLASEKIYGENLLESMIPEAAEFMQLMERRPHVRSMMSDRDDAMATFVGLNVKYDG